MSLILAIESTCDETAAAIVRDGTDVLSSVVATQFHLHAKFRGVVPEIASRAHIENILPVIQEAATQANLPLSPLDAVAVAHRPGLIGSLLIGVTAAKTLAWLLNKPLIGIDHVQAHLYSVMLRDASQSQISNLKSQIPSPPSPSPQSQIANRKSQIPPPSLATRNSQLATLPSPAFPAAGAVLSGGHTALYLLHSWTDITRLGGTIDDAIGEAYDKVAAILGLPFPGGPALAALATQGNPKAIHFPRSLFAKDSLDFSLSGLKTSVLYRALGPKGTARKHTDLSHQEKADLAASFQAAVLDVLFEKLRRLIHQTQAKSLLLGGGVISNTALRARLQTLPIPTFTPEKQYCTDNAAMSAGLAHVLLEQNQLSPLTLDAITNSAILPAPAPV